MGEDADVIEPLQTVLVAGSLLLALLALVQVVLDRPVGGLLVGASGLLLVGLLAQAVVGIVQVAGGDRDIATATFVGYLIGCLLVLPAGVVWSLGERSRGGTAVLAVAGLTTAFLVVRVVQIWGA